MKSNVFQIYLTLQTETEMTESAFAYFSKQEYLQYVDWFNDKLVQQVFYVIQSYYFCRLGWLNCILDELFAAHNTGNSIFWSWIKLYHTIYM